jgi:hypothetical protein
MCPRLPCRILDASPARLFCDRMRLHPCADQAIIQDQGLARWQTRTLGKRRPESLPCRGLRQYFGMTRNSLPRMPLKLVLRTILFEVGFHRLLSRGFRAREASRGTIRQTNCRALHRQSVKTRAKLHRQLDRHSGTRQVLAHCDSPSLDLRNNRRRMWEQPRMPRLARRKRMGKRTNRS